ncbi:MAG: hypothetical protein EA383_17740 [Spirochaetaceae bacterium]|nr:MAG: hypothetical protein EA383_17740 [Spirochaetaceae bacterium]
MPMIIPMNEQKANGDAFEALLQAPFERLEQVAELCVETRFSRIIQRLEEIETELDLFVRTAGSREPSTLRHRMPILYKRRSCEQ